MFIRHYSQGGVDYTCTAACDVRGPGIEEVEHLDPADINCPSCLKLLRNLKEASDGRRN